ncbi:1210_t:CDS:1, partial [Diversispora eburnea]
MERNPTTICRFIAKYKKTGNFKNLPQSRWPPALNNNEKNVLVTEVSKQCHTPLMLNTQHQPLEVV